MEKARFHLVMLDPGKVGKTSITRRYLHGTFDGKTKKPLRIFIREIQRFLKSKIQTSDVWSQIVQQRKDARILPTVIVGNKCDSSSQKKCTKQQKLRSRVISPTGKLSRNRSFRVSKSSGSSPKDFNRSDSLLRRTKHLSLTMKHHDKEVPSNLPDESNCKIS
ncbi:unnamed protein product [Onchocerca ochengi]|uniref:GTP-binding protein Di-Ras2 n=1 Tax=Onchocerca ochengi TaxID=42157 RepID=A0A182E0U4_ONCOC|nr:unnamed protein product [Onchocerca ochengi]